MLKLTSQKIAGNKVEAKAPQPTPTTKRAKSIDIVVVSDVSVESRQCQHCSHIFCSVRSLRRHHEEAKYCMLIRTQKELEDLKAEMAKHTCNGKKIGQKILNIH